MEIDIKGEVVDGSTGQMMSWFGMQNTNPATIQNLLNQADKEDIDLNISSPGGDPTAAAEIYTMLKQYPGKINGTIQGMAASAASVIAEACDHLTISPVGSMMIHKVMVNGTSGNADDLEHQVDVLNKLDQTICNAYQAKTGKSRDEILNLMKTETWLTPEQAVDQGFADEVMSVGQNNESLQLTNSTVSIPLKDKVNEFMKFLASKKEENQSNKSANTYENKSSALFNEKLAILKGEKYVN